MKTEQTKAMIISVGGTPEPIVKTIQHHAPSYVCFFASQGTFDKIAVVKDSLGEMRDEITFEVVVVDNENDLVECYEKGRSAVARPFRKGISKEYIIVDYTGGTKNMSVALALAAIDAGYGFSYVGGDRRTKGGVGIVETGHERVYTHINPWDFMALKERRRVCELFNAFQFKAAMEILRDLAENACTMHSTYRALAFVTEGYLLWDLFRHAEAQERFKKARLDALLDSPDAAVRRIAMETEKLLDFLQTLISCSDRGRKPCRPMIVDLFSNAQRRFAEGKTDDAILRLYRVLEMAAQERLLSAWKIDTACVDPGLIPETLREEYVKRYKNPRSGNIEIPQNASYQLLHELGDPLGKAFREREKDFRDIQSARNTSYLAHGFGSSSEATYEKFRSLLMEIVSLSPEETLTFPRLELQ